MEALAALSVAAAAVQFLDFGIETTRAFKDIWTSSTGASKENLDCEKRITHLKVLIDELRCSSAAEGRANSGTGTSESVRRAEDLYQCNLECDRIATELLVLLNKIKVGEQKSFKVAKATIKAMCKRNEIQRVEEKLGKYRNIMTLQILSELRQQSIKHALRQENGFQKLSEDHQQVLREIAAHRTAVLASISSVHEDVRASMQPSRTSGREISQGAADMGGQPVTPSVAPYYNGTKTGAGLGFQERGSLVLKISRDSQGVNLETTGNLLLESLRFPEMDMRIDSIGSADEETLQWIFDDSKLETKRWAPFSKWLRSREDPIYWINGKAGSGKSTLMSFVIRHKQTLELLSIWADGEKLITPTMFFWSAGTSMQKSLLGLYRSLVFKILRSCPEYMDLAIDPHHTISYAVQEWDLDSLSLIMRRICSQESTRICFFIDGLDEYEGTYSMRKQLIALFENLTCQSGGRVKCCVSSRPESPFEQAYHNKPCLQLQDLTEQAIAHYVSTNLGQGTPFLDKISFKARGVFLWVRLTVDSLLQGIDEGCSVAELEERLDALPDELNALYGHMIRKLNKQYQDDAASFFQLLSTAPNEPGLVSFTLATNASLFEHLVSGVEPWKISDQLSRETIRTLGIIKPRTAGLLEVHRHDGAYAGEPQASQGYGQWAYDYGCLGGILDGKAMYYRVQFLHRTVLDFLRGSHQTFPWMDSSHGEARISHIRSHILQASTHFIHDDSCEGGADEANEDSDAHLIDCAEKSQAEADCVALHVKEVIEQARALEAEGSVTPFEILLFLETLLETAIPSERALELIRATSNVIEDGNGGDAMSGFLSLAAQAGLLSYVSERLSKIQKVTGSVPQELVTRLLRLTCPSNHSAYNRAAVSKGQNFRLLQHLLRLGADPHCLFRSSAGPERILISQTGQVDIKTDTTWQHFLTLLLEYSWTMRHRPLSFNSGRRGNGIKVRGLETLLPPAIWPSEKVVSVVSAFIIAGADLDAIMVTRELNNEEAGAQIAATAGWVVSTSGLCDSLDLAAKTIVGSSGPCPSPTVSWVKIWDYEPCRFDKDEVDVLVEAVGESWPVSLPVADRNTLERVASRWASRRAAGVLHRDWPGCHTSGSSPA